MTVDLAVAPADMAGVVAPAETDVLFAQLEAEIKESARALMRAHVEDVGVRIGRALQWCNEFHRAGVRWVGRPTGAMVAHEGCGYCSGQQQDPHRRFHDLDGLDAHSYDQRGWRDGYGPDGFNDAGFDRLGYNREGLNAAGMQRYRFNELGFDLEGFNLNGFNMHGYDRDGYNSRGYNIHGRDRDGYDRAGWAEDGFNRQNIDRNGADRDGLDMFGLPVFRFNVSGIDGDGYNRHGEHHETGHLRTRVR